MTTNLIFHSMKNGLFTAACGVPLMLISRMPFSEAFGSVFFTSTIASGLLRKFVPRNFNGSPFEVCKSLMVISAISLASSFIYEASSFSSSIEQLLVHLGSFASSWVANTIVLNLLREGLQDLKIENLKREFQKELDAVKNLRNWTEIQKQLNASRLHRIAGFLKQVGEELVFVEAGQYKLKRRITDLEIKQKYKHLLEKAKMRPWERSGYRSS